MRGVAIVMCGTQDVGRFQVAACAGKDQVVVWLDSVASPDLVVKPIDPTASSASVGTPMFF